MSIWITLWALWMTGIVVLNVSRMRRRGVRYRRGQAYDSSSWSSSWSSWTGDVSSSSFDHDSGGSSWGGCDSGSSWGDSSSSSSDSGSSSSSC